MATKRRFGRRIAGQRRRRGILQRARHAGPAIIVLGLCCAAAGAAITAVAPEPTVKLAAATPITRVTAVEAPPPPIAPGVVRLPADPLAAAGPVEAEEKIASGDTLSAVLDRAGVERVEAARSIQALRDVYDPRDLRAGDVISLSFAPDVAEAAPGRLLGLQLVKSYDRVAGVGRTLDGGFSAYEIVKPLKLERARGAGAIQSSLFVDGVNAGVPVRSMAEFIRLFSYDIDFQRDLHPGDKFDILYTRHVDQDGEMAHPGDILFAALETGGRKISIYRHEYADGRVNYFNAKGRSNKKALLRTPVDGARISSGFGRRRHPILGYSKMHAGIDFAAPTGTPIKAAGDGVVQRAGWFGGYGRYIRIKHNNNYATAYAHLRRYAKGIKAGKRVRQGQIIGYVGSSGRSTGPHLHYEILKNGRQVNPARQRFQSAEALKGKELKRFKANKARMDAYLQDLAPPAVTAQKQ